MPMIFFLIFLCSLVIIKGLLFFRNLSYILGKYSLQLTGGVESSRVTLDLSPSNIGIITMNVILPWDHHQEGTFLVHA
jgi:hypothetical protein